MKKHRGKQKKPTLVHVSIRIDRDTYAYFDRYVNRSDAIRLVLDDFVQRKKEEANVS